MCIQAIHFSPKSWAGPDGETSFIPKNEGIGIMVYAFHSREFGFGFSWDDLSDSYLKRINYFRADKAYMDKYASKLLRNGITLKKDLSREDNHFLVLFEYGNYENKQGYWSYDHFVLQMEYCLECLKFITVLYLYFYFFFLFDRSCGIDQALEGILKAIIMRKYSGGKQPNMRDTVILG